jgi:hypothetical protein
MSASESSGQPVEVCRIVLITNNELLLEGGGRAEQPENALLLQVHSGIDTPTAARSLSTRPPIDIAKPDRFCFLEMIQCRTA